MAYEYKMISTDEGDLNAHGRAFWQVVGIVKQDPDGKVLLARDLTMQAVVDGLSDPPPGMLLYRVVIEPTEPHERVDLADSMQHLDREPLGGYTTAQDSIISRDNVRGVPREWFQVWSSGRVQYTHQDAVQRAVIHDLYWADQSRRYVGDISGLFQHWGYEGRIRAVLTVSGILGYTFQRDRDWANGQTVDVPFIQVSQEMPVSDIGTREDSPMLKALFGKLYWSLGSAVNLAFRER